MSDGTSRKAQLTPQLERTLDAGSVALQHWGTPIVTRHVADDVVDRLVTAVALGLYVTGQQLPTERELAAMLSVSRTSVREALKQLTETGYLEVRRGRNGGYFVLADWGPSSAEHVRRQLVANWREFEQIFDARTLIEPLIARTAATRRTTSDIDAMKAALEAYLNAPDREASRRADSDLHLAIAEATHNSILVACSVDLRTRISLNLGAEPYTEEVRRIAKVQHQQLVAAVSEGRADEAADIAARHFILSENLFADWSIAPSTRTSPCEGEHEPASPFHPAAIVPHDPHAVRDERRGVPNHPAGAGRPGAHDARVSRHRGQCDRATPSAWPRSEPRHPIPQLGRRNPARRPRQGHREPCPAHRTLGAAPAGDLRAHHAVDDDRRARWRAARHLGGDRRSLDPAR